MNRFVAKQFQKTFQIFGRFFIFSLLNISSVYAQSAAEYLYDGNDNLKQDKLKQAIADYTKAIDINPNLAKAYNNRGVAYAKLGRLPQAISDFTMAIADNSNDAEAYNNRGHAYAQLGNFIQAISDYTKAIRIKPGYAKAYINRGLALYKVGNFDKAWADVRKAEELGVTVDPDFIKELRAASARSR